MTQYKPCCERRCLVHGCKTREQGACYCICKMWDSVHHLESIIEGKTLYDGIGMQYIPDDEYRKKVYDSWSKEKQETFQEFKNVEAPNLMKKIKNKIKEFEIDVDPIEP